MVSAKLAGDAGKIVSKEEAAAYLKLEATQAELTMAGVSADEISEALSILTGVSPLPAAVKGVVTPTKQARKPSPQGIFAPLVKGAKQVMGEKELNALRAEVIVAHSGVISSFVDTSESKFGQLVLKRMFEAADTDGNGTLDKAEVRAALEALGFDFFNDKQVDGIYSRADKDDNEVIDFEEFVKEAPKTLRTSLVKLAKKNGHDLGFLA